MTTRALIAAASLTALAAPAMGQLSLLVADRNANSLWMLVDINGDGIIQNPDEVFLWHNSANEPGTLGIENLNTLARRADGLVLGGDQVRQGVYFFQDVDQNGDAQGMGESAVVQRLPNAESINIAFPTGSFFLEDGNALVVNAGNAFGADAIYRLVDLDGDGVFLSAGEVQPYVTTGAFGAVPNGPWSPQEIYVFPSVGGAPQVGYLRNSSANLHGISRFVDLDGNGRADDPGEFTPFFSIGNASGVPVTAGFALEPDHARPGALYMLQLASGGVDQVVRVQDLDGDGNANGVGEARLVYSNAETGFTSVDLVCLANGDLLISDNSGKRIIRLRDEDGDGLFSADEATVIFSGAPLVNEVRQMIEFPFTFAPPCPADFNNDGGVDGADVEAFFLAWEAGDTIADVNGDGGVDGADVETFFSAWEAGGC
ncbi:MAG: hypothetical protein KF859_06585 [Phycisphaeraceae bacterium]|nr:hypothetical protein [Phycisphaeraceae bacterium]